MGAGQAPALRGSGQPAWTTKRTSLPGVSQDSSAGTTPPNPYAYTRPGFLGQGPKA